VDVYSRRILAHRTAITLEAVHAVEALQEAYARFGKPEIINTDQGSQFTAQEFVDAVMDNGVKLSMDGRGAWRDNVFVERIWRSVKYERVYLRAYESVSIARKDIAEYIDWYNGERGHSSLDGKTPEQVWRSSLLLLEEAA
jgi:Integrase core domain.